MVLCAQNSVAETKGFVLHGENGVVIILVESGLFQRIGHLLLAALTQLAAQAYIVHDVAFDRGL